MKTSSTGRAAVKLLLTVVSIPTLMVAVNKLRRVKFNPPNFRKEKERGRR